MLKSKNSNTEYEVLQGEQVDELKSENVNNIMQSNKSMIQNVQEDCELQGD